MSEKNAQNDAVQSTNDETNVSTDESTNGNESTSNEPQTYTLAAVVAFVARKKGISEDRAAKHVRSRIRAYKSDLAKLDTTGNLAKHNRGDSYQPFSAECARGIISLALRANVANVVQESADVNALMAPAVSTDEK